jgi:hypothetical protein
VTLHATDVTSGINKTYFRVDADSLWQNYTGPIEVSGDTEHVVEFYSVDVAGNIEAPKTLKIEKEDEGGWGGLGFTFWITLAAIAILASIAIPAIFGMRRKAKESDAKAPIKDIGTAIAQLKDDSVQKERPPKTEE